MSGCVATIGVFDGVHRGHRALIAAARAEADALGCELVAVTFDPHPLSVLRPDLAPTSLAPLPQRIRLLQEAGADRVHVLAFDEAMSLMSPEEFISDVLVDELQVRGIVVGEDFRFGHRAAGTVATLREGAVQHGYEVISVPLVGEGAERWSSTNVRRLLADGDVSGAAAALGREYSLIGTVVHGDHRGREFGIPTANLQCPPDATIPGDGVYAGWLAVAGDRLPAAISIGTNPQFAGSERRVEAHVLDREDLDLYGRDVEVRFAGRIRDQWTFPDLDAFVARMAVDIQLVREVLAAP